MPEVTLNGIKTFYRIDGAGPRTFVLLNGAGCTTGTWGELADGLAGLGTVVRFDARGAGQTETPNDPFSMETMADDALALMDYLKVQKPIIIAHAFGGRIAQIFTRDHPERVRALILCGTGGKFPPLPHGLEAKVSPDMDRETRIEVFFARWFGSQFRVKHPERARRIIEENFATTSASPPESAIGRRMPRLSPADSYWGKVPETVPVLLVYGTEDKYGTVENVNDLAGRLKNSKLIFIEGAGHLAIQEEPERIAAEIRKFIEERGL
jgi:pimeloyl-ACP methyl ester carboxylesterase